MAVKPKITKTPLSEYSTSEIREEANWRGIETVELSDFSDDDLIDEMADRGIKPRVEDQEPIYSPKHCTTDALFQELMSRSATVNSRQTGLQVRLDIQVAGRPVCNAYGPMTVLWKRD